MVASLDWNGLVGSRPFMLFLGRNTAGSLAAKVFPEWMRLFDADCRLACLNMPRDSSNNEYVNVLRRMRELKNCVGMQVTNHKVRLYEASSKCFDYSSNDVRILEEIGGVVVSDGDLTAVSPDAAALRFELKKFLGSDSPTEIILLGGGGASRAVALVSSTFPQVRKITMTEINPERRSALGQWVEVLRSRGVFQQIDVLPADANDEVTSSASDGALIVNASGMGKDTLGSPINPEVAFPRGSIIWDLNYRGELAFLAHAHGQAEKRDLLVSDGFALFISNWTWLLETILDKRLDDEARTAFWRTTELMRGESQTSHRVVLGAIQTAVF